MIKYLVIPDCHISSEDKNIDRFKDVGELIVNERPDYVVFLGDFLSFESLSHWDKNKPLILEGRRYEEELKKGRAAIKNIFSPVKKNLFYQRKQKKKTYFPSLIWCDGNHEDWVERYVEKHPELYGADLWNIHKAIGLDTIGSSILYAPYKYCVNVNNIAFTHVPISGNTQPISGKYVVHRAADMFNCHIVFGHTHRLEMVHKKRHGASLQLSLSCGNFFETMPKYAKGSLNPWWKGLIMLHQDGGDRVDVQTIAF